MLPLVVVVSAAAQAPHTVVAGPWASELAQFEAADRAHPPAPGGVLFVGSSSVRMWQSLSTDFPGVPVLNRGFGGSELADVVKLCDRVVLPYRPRVVVLYAGDNDIGNGRTPADVAGALQTFVSTMHRQLPATRVVYVSIKPSPARWGHVEQIREANRLARALAATDSLLRFVDVFTPMLDSTGHPRRELYQGDGLHMTLAGYAIWRQQLAPLVR